MDNNTIVFNIQSDSNQPVEMLRIEPSGFFVQGKKVPVDDREALAVYNSFNQWLVWAKLTQTE